MGHSCSENPAALSACDVIVEFTNPDAADENVPRWRDTGAHVVIGTSGYTAARLDTLTTDWAASVGRCLVVPNFAIGAVLMMRFAELAAPHFDSGEIVEMHHEDKPDAPSGTALATAARMAAARVTRQATTVAENWSMARSVPASTGSQCTRCASSVRSPIRR